MMEESYVQNFSNIIVQYLLWSNRKGRFQTANTK